MNTFIKFCIGGGAVFFFEYFLTLILVEFFDFPEISSYAFSLALGIILLYYIHKTITFKLHHNCYKMFTKFVIFTGITYLLNFGLTSITINAGVVYWIAIPIVNAVLSMVVYGVNKKIIFKNKVTCDDF